MAAPALGQDRLALTYSEVAKAVGLSVRSIWSLVAAGKLRALRIGRSVRILRSDLDEYLAERLAVGVKVEGK